MLFNSPQLNAGSLEPCADDVLFPLSAIYRRAGISQPAWTIVEPGDIPMPYRKLLVHTDRMTLRLERYFDTSLAIRTLSSISTNHSYLRLVILIGKTTNQPAELGAIRIQLSAFTRSIRREIVTGTIPLGRLLQS